MYTSGFRQPMAILTTPDGVFLGGSALSAIDRPETVHSLELSGTWFAHPNLGLTLNAFYNRFDNPHSLTTDTATGKLLFTQGGAVDFVGGEAIVQYRLQEKVTIQFAHQLVLLGNKVDDPYHTFKAPTGRTLLFYPENVTKGSITWGVAHNASLSIGGLFVHDSLGYLPSGAVARTGNYALLNANLLLGDPRTTGQLGLGLNNLLDDKTRVPMPATVGRPSDMVPMAGFSFLLSYYRAF
jgi:outer membrane receptor protein involved in Fe transport